MTSPLVAAPPRPKLNVQQSRIYRFAAAYLRARHCSPTLHDLVSELGLKNVDTAREHLQKIAKKGWISYDASAERGIGIVEASQ